MPTIINGTDNTAATPALTGTDTDTGVFFPAANTMAFSTGGTERMRITSAGDLGIGTNNPTEKLDVVANPSGENGAIVVRTQFGAHYFGGVGNYPAFGYMSGGVLTAALGYDTNNNVLFTGPSSAKFSAYLCRAWVNFNGTGTVAIRGSGNVSSITDGGTGNYTVNLTNAMPDANYSVSLTALATGSNLFSASLASNVSASNFNFITVNSSSVVTDPTTVCCSVFR
jgi:hypothetical protein